MSIEIAVIGDRLVVVEEGPGAPLPETHSPPDAVEEAALCCAHIIRERPFSRNNRETGYQVMRQMLEDAGRSWPRPHEDAPAIETILSLLEAEKISVEEFVEWVRLRVATA